MVENNLTVKAKMPSFKKGIALNREKAEQTIREIDPKTLPNRLGLVFDDSGSMSGEAIINAHNAVKNFTQSCNYQDTSICIYPLNADPKPLTVDYDVLNLYITSVGATGGTPLYTTLLKLIESESITRAVVFSDGSPTDAKLIGVSEAYDSKPADFAFSVVKRYKREEPLTSVPVDTIFIGEQHEAGYNEMKKLAEMTGGIFIHFKDSTSLNQNLKYLAPRYRALLANADLKSRIEKGEKI